MLGLALALALAAPNLEALDNATLALVSCRFGVIRSGVARHSGRDRIAAALAAGCTAELARYRALAIVNQVARGKSRPAAAAELDRQSAKDIADMVAQYDRFEAMGLFKPAS